MFYIPGHLRELAGASTAFSQCPRPILIEIKGKVSLMAASLERRAAGCVFVVSGCREET